MLDVGGLDAPRERGRPDLARFSGTRNAKRQTTRERIHTRIVHPIDTPRLVHDPLERRESRALSVLAAVRLVIATGVIHVAVMLSFAVAGHLMGQQATYQPPERLSVQIVETRPPPPVVEEPPAEPAAIVPEFQPVTPPKSPEAPKAPRAEDAPEPAPAPEPDPVPRRIVGLSLESTVEGNGPSFATGTSRLGATETRAADPKSAQRAPAPSAAPGPSPLPGSTQRVASHIPTRDTEFEKPRRLKPNRPEFPAALKAQGIEGDVTVRVDIAASGEVTNVSTVRSSGYPAFDEAARKAAASERFAPAIRDGTPVPFTLSYSYRFRIED
jgi:periplasmic protein TonB